MLDFFKITQNKMLFFCKSVLLFSQWRLVICWFYAIINNRKVIYICALVRCDGRGIKNLIAVAGGAATWRIISQDKLG